VKASHTMYRPVRVYEALILGLILAITIAVVGISIDRSTDVVTDTGGGTATTTRLPSTATVTVEDYQALQSGEDSETLSSSSNEFMQGGAVTTLTQVEAAALARKLGESPAAMRGEQEVDGHHQALLRKDSDDSYHFEPIPTDSGGPSGKPLP
jgi:hypothetical protein